MIDEIEAYLEETCSIIKMLEKNDIKNFCNGLKAIKKNNGRLFVAGVGGSAANASHFVNDLRKICNLESYSLSDNIAELTAQINDSSWQESYLNIFKNSQPNKNDAILILSVGGGSQYTSQNLVKLIEYCHQNEQSIFSIVSRDGGIAKKFSNFCIHIPIVSDAHITQHAEEFQMIICHLISSILNKG